MYYYTRYQSPKEEQLTWDDLISGKVDIYSHGFTDNRLITGTITTKDYKFVPFELNNAIVHALNSFNERYKDLFEVKRNSLYHKFYIPKRHGGKREINEPNPELMEALNSLRYILENVCGGLYHTSAFAYIKGRSTKDMDMKHALNGSNWFLKTDFSGFFPSTTLDFVMYMFGMIYPFYALKGNSDHWNAFRKAMSLAFLNGGLPQGSPVSPTITNIMMIPIDHQLFNEFAHRHMVYTRYADDIAISCVQSFNYKEIVSIIENTLTTFHAPFTLKDEKTRYVNNRGSNWMLGLMVNKDHQVTIGHEKKKYFKATLCNFIMDTKNGKHWNPEDVIEMNGNLAYYSMVEKEYFKYLIDHMNQKFHVDIKSMISKEMHG